MPDRPPERKGVTVGEAFVRLVKRDLLDPAAAQRDRREATDARPVTAGDILDAVIMEPLREAGARSRRRDRPADPPPARRRRGRPPDLPDRAKAYRDAVLALKAENVARLTDALIGQRIAADAGWEERDVLHRATIGRWRRELGLPRPEDVT